MKLVPQTVGSVLIVDDSGAQRRFAAALCRELGIAAVREAGNGQEALAILDALASPPALLIIDLEMPTMDGLELLGALRERGVSAPIVIASSRERALVHSVQGLGGALGLRILGAVQKPLTLAGLASLLSSDAGTAVQPERPGDVEPVDPETLRSALDGFEITVHYQPQVEIDTGYVRGVEALARWTSPALGVVSPERFVRTAEQHGMVHQLTLQVLNQALLQAAAWSGEGLELRVAVNLSPVLLNRAQLVEEISELQQCHGVPPDRIVLEVTESTLLGELAVALGVLTRLRLRGFRLSLDDYGTGFSSMQQLARIPFTELKIDRSFVHGAHDRESLRVILRSALDLAGKLGIETVAEGLETMPDWRLLREYGCTLAQGWLLAKAMPAERFAPWLKTHLARRPVLLASPTCELAPGDHGCRVV
jgi:EAL domain-containing protein (putative c-di-GMP-specific phosphodiesterase class I)